MEDSILGTKKMPRSSAERQLRVALLFGDMAFPSGPTAVDLSFFREGSSITPSPHVLGTKGLEEVDAAPTVPLALPCSLCSSAKLIKG